MTTGKKIKTIAELFEESKITNEKILKEHEGGTRFGNWKIQPNGDLVFLQTEKDGEYIINKAMLTETDWISHINTKGWGNESMGDFITAYFTALNNIGVKNLTIRVY